MSLHVNWLLPELLHRGCVRIGIGRVVCVFRPRFSMNRDRPSRRAVAIPQCRPLAQASPPQAPQPPCLRSTPPWTTTWVCSSLLSLCRKTCLLWLPTIHRLVALYSLSVSFVGRLFSFNCCAVCLRVCVCRFAQLTCSQDRELSTPSDRWLPTFYSMLTQHIITSRVTITSLFFNPIITLPAV